MTPQDIKLWHKTKIVELTYDQNQCFKIPFAYFYNKNDQNIINFEIIDNIGVKFIFDQGKRYFDWESLYQFCQSSSKLIHP